ncbi:MAG: UDP-glucose/GDP-mannose dehydrogenase family protein [Actinomycetota bacterium]|nr:UDP-glucose/GDP-mannose dehydrogenase family protein [Actinomycetota bacterium]
MKLAVVGTGHIGLVICTTMAAIGHEVVGVDSDPEKIASLEQRRSPFYEPGLQDLLEQELDSGRLSFTSDISRAAPGAEAVFICVGTPPRASGEASLVAVEKAAASAARAATRRMVIIEKSTVPAGTSVRVKRTLARERPDLEGQIEVASNPEFLREGKAVEDSLNPERILVGAETDWAFEVLRRVYEPLTSRGIPLIETDIQTAELAKHACNAFLALKISYANALAVMCEKAGADVVAIAQVMGTDSRISPAFLNAGLGYGGYCFPKDLQAFERLAHKLGYDFALLKEVERINEQAVDAAVHKVTDALWNLEDKKVTLLGLAFKPETDDVRFAPALAVARRLLAEGARVVGWDPEAGGPAKAEVPDLEVASDVFDALEGAHCAVVCTEWNEIRSIDLARVKDAMAYPVIVDGRNVFEPAQMAQLGFTYYPTGRPPVA